MAMHKWALMRPTTAGRARTEKTCYAEDEVSACTKFREMRRASGISNPHLPGAWFIKDQGPVDQVSEATGERAANLVVMEEMMADTVEEPTAFPYKLGDTVALRKQASPTRLPGHLGTVTGITNFWMEVTWENDPEVPRNYRLRDAHEWICGVEKAPGLPPTPEPAACPFQVGDRIKGNGWLSGSSYTGKFIMVNDEGGIGIQADGDLNPSRLVWLEPATTSLIEDTPVPPAIMQERVAYQLLGTRVEELRAALGLPGASWDEMLEKAKAGGKAWCSFCHQTWDFQEHGGQEAALALAEGHERSCFANPLVLEIAILRDEKAELQRKLNVVDECLVKTLDQRDEAQRQVQAIQNAPKPMATFAYSPGHWGASDTAGLSLEDRVWLIRHLHHQARQMASLLLREFAITIHPNMAIGKEAEV